MSLTIIRNTGFLGSAGYLKVKINREKVAKLRLDEPNILDLNQHKSTIQVKHWGSKSNALEVSDGDAVEIRTRKWVMPSFVFILLIPLFTSLFDTQTVYILFGIFLVGFLITNWKLGTYFIEYIGSENSQN